MFKLEINKVFTIPFETCLKFTKEMFPQTKSEKKDMKKVPYQSVVSSLIYRMICTRPNITYSMRVVSQFLIDLGETHWKVVKRIFKYIKGT